MSTTARARWARISATYSRSAASPAAALDRQTSRPCRVGRPRSGRPRSRRSTGRRCRARSTPDHRALAGGHRPGLEVRGVAELGDGLVDPARPGAGRPVRGPSLTTRDAVVSDTPARSATSCKVTRARWRPSAAARPRPARPRLRASACQPVSRCLPRLDPRLQLQSLARSPAESRWLTQAIAGQSATSGTSPFHGIAPHGQDPPGSRLPCHARSIQVAMNGVTGRMGYRQHLVRSRAGHPGAGRRRPRADGTTGSARSRSWSGGSEAAAAGDRRAARHRALDDQPGRRARPTRASRCTSTRRSTSAGKPALAKAIAAGKHVYTEKPVADSAGRRGAAGPGGPRGRDDQRRGAGQAVPARDDQAAAADQRGLLRPGAVDPAGVRLLGVRGRRAGRAAARPGTSASEDGGGIVLDMFPHWQYLLEDLFGPITALYARQATHLPRALGRVRHQVRRGHRRRRRVRAAGVRAAGRSRR